MAAAGLFDPSAQHARLQAATSHLEAPLGAVDLEAFDANAADLVKRAAGTPIRVATKSVRCRSLIDRALGMNGFAGAMAFTLPEALVLARDIDDVLMGYPTVSRQALAALAADETLAGRVTLMVDSVAQLDLVDDVVAPSRRASLRICLDLDASLRALGGRVHLGPRRSPVHDVSAAVALAREVAGRPGFELVGLMAYEGQVAGQVDVPLGKSWAAPAIGVMKSLSIRQLVSRRAAVVAAVGEVAELEFVNGGGTGSIDTTVAEDCVTEVAAGSGLFAPTLFDRYKSFDLTPAAFFALDVTRLPAPGIATVAGGGWIASGPAGPDRLPEPTYPAGLSLISIEGAGEVQTPLTGAGGLSVGDRVWFRHAKAGELCEHVSELHLVDGDRITATVPTYRGEKLT
jgi:D-serine deaminase-like pyridoxal phosphate-dependent protein